MRSGNKMAKMLFNTLLYSLLVNTCFSCATGASDSSAEAPPAPQSQACYTYYVDAATGSDQNTGTSESAAWKTLARASQQKLNAGDQLLLRRGQTFEGELEITGKGSEDKRIEVGCYGTGGNPVIKGYDQSRYAIRILNSDYLTLSGFEIVNTGKERMAGRTGVKVECTNYGVSHDIRITDLYIHDVNGSLSKDAGGGSAILIENGGKTIASRFDGLLIEGCHIKDCGRNGMIWSGYWERQDWLPSTHVVVRGNLIEGVPGDGIVPIGCDGCLIEYNVMRDCPDILPADQAAAGFWPWSCDNTIIQYNEVSGHKAPWDAQGFDCDYNCRNTLMQYNYSHDNYGGMMLICDSGNERNYSIGNQGSIVRYNISIGDGIRPKETRDGMFSPALHLCGKLENTLVERNIIHQNVKESPDIDHTMICSNSWDGYPDGTTFRENIFYSAELSKIDITKSTANIFEHNWYLGKCEAYGADNKSCSASSIYQKQVLDVDANGYSGLQSLMDSKTLFGQSCHFVNKTAIERFFDEMLR